MARYISELTECTNLGPRELGPKHPYEKGQGRKCQQKQNHVAEGTKGAALLEKSAQVSSRKRDRLIS